MKFLPILTLLLLSLASTASADVITEEESACRRRSEGDFCVADGQDGTCQPGRCCRPDYSNGSPPQGSICNDCLLCEPDPAEPVETAGTDAGGVTVVDAAQEGDSESIFSSPFDYGGRDVGMTTDGGGDDEEEGCSSVTPTTDVPTTPLLSFLVGLGLVVVVRRRRA